MGCLFVALTNCFSLLSPWILKNAIDEIRLNISSEILLKYAGLIFAVAIAEAVFRFLMRYTIISASRKIEYDLRNDFFAHLQTLSQSFYNRNKTGDLMARATNDLEAVRLVVGPAVMYSLNTLVSMAAFGIMVNINLKLTLLAILPFPIMAFVVHRIARKLNKAHLEIQTQYAAITSKVQENFSGIRIIKAYVQELGEIKVFKGLNRDFIDKNLSMVKLRGLMMASMGILVGIGSLIVLWFGGSEVIRNNLTLGEFVAFFAYLSMLTWPMIALGWVINLFQQGNASMRRLNGILNTKPDIDDLEKADDVLQNIEGKIEFRSVSFAYKDVTVLKDINLKIKKGMTLAIVGPTGCGKSSLINLIPRMFDATEGEVLIDGKNVQEIPLQVLRKNIGYVPQDTFLFSETIRNNIAFGVNAVGEDEIFEAAEVSQIRKDVLDFPKQFETLLGERGINISGGQKQRTAIARAVIRKPKILILDDSLSAVDTYTEEAILQGLKKIMAERTSIIVSHRVSAVKEAELIIYLKDGEIVERGTHDELVALGGHYAELFEKQLLEEALETY